MLRDRLLLLPLTAACISFSVMVGCDRVYVATNTGIHGSGTSAPLPQVTVLEGLGKDLVFSQAQVDRPPGNPMRVVVPVQARGNNDLAVQYRFMFFDEVGNPLDQTTGWQNMLLSAWVQRFLDGTSRTDKATVWHLEVRPAQ